jgi:hypothetical protein
MSMLCVQMMQEWLALHKLDRKQLAALAGNAQAAQVYEAYLHQTVQEVMEDLLADFDEPEPESEPAQGTSQLILLLTVWGVEPVVTHQTSWLESTGVCGVRQKQAGGSSV